MKRLQADREGRVLGLAGLYPPLAIVYVDSAGNYGGMEIEPEAPPTTISIPPQLHEELHVEGEE